ncbi:MULTISPECIES: XTP/dITP diphosphatase [Methylocaldum]|jgi:XTP/dITP diphosphohydrolase|uniref:XTP/dITP diphosphatase n=1 Tax=unclassified Methylocaldum TaxID=2622260 RepID=UPI00098A49E0|nr:MULTISPECIES: XTP/dITP diphosphatase [unclassified Methylocaldum]MBP1152913.1 XTP/dITP diphosphohydrolase [Methylocaldum sp. RMAD-M]MDV3242811.1 XTP/dITP diphosphatase [Methylocaldum sp.]MVF24109.1 XTP/dITP diphosphatase [Methylocaldum sp. BRCS4]
MKKILLASNNPGKVREIQAILANDDIEIVPQSAFGVPDIEEVGLTFVENAILKARHASQLSGLPAIADDSGLEVNALGGAPGVFSARYAGPGANDAENNAKLLRELENIPDAERTARFRCVMVFLRHAQDPSPLIGQGVWEGIILREPRGKGGFGYDPLFFVLEKNCTSAELSPDEKNRLSHRGKALRELVAQMRDSAK